MSTSCRQKSEVSFEPAKPTTPSRPRKLKGKPAPVARGAPTPAEMGAAAAATFGEKLRAARLEADLTQKELAARVGCHYKTVECLEQGSVTSAPTRGDQGPRWSTVVALSAALGLPVAHFLPGC